MQKKGARVSYYDPYLPFLKWNGIDLKCVKFDKDSFKNADCVVIVTDHSKVDYKFIARNSRLIVDTRNALKDIKNKANIIKL
ncbi:MAG: hypothetical protein HZA30_05620 [Candidatus Omnitrophica bacterium]|nr:hypothetical protein [Candidatus Omnitrophota bacterium]